MKALPKFRKTTLSLAIGLALTGQQAYALTYCSTEIPLDLTVTSLADTVDDYDGVLTLREALNQVQAAGARADCTDPDVITFDASLDGGTLTITNGWIGPTGANNVLITTENDARITLTNSNTSQALFSVNEGSKAIIENLVFDGELTERNYPLLDISGAGATTIRNTEFKNYRRPATDLYAGAKGAVYIYSSDDVLVENSTFTNNISNQGGALSAVNTVLTITDSTFSGNQADGSGGTAAYGGAVYFSTTTGDQLTINTSSLSSNKVELYGAGGHGAAVYASGTDVTVEINDSELLANQTNDLDGTYTNNGGAVYINSTNPQLNIEGSRLNDNSTDANGGAIYLEGSNCGLQIVDSALIGNSAGLNGGAIRTFGPGTTCTINVTQSTIASNSANGGGGISADSTTNVTLTQSTLTLNTATYFGGALYSSSEYGSSLTCNHSVIADNKVGDPSNIYGWVSVTADHCYIADGALLGDVTDDVYIPQEGSPLIDAGDAAYTPYSDYDQRGDQRVRGSAIDIGAAESGNTAPTRTVTDQPVIELVTGINTFDTTTELGISDNDGTLIYTLQTSGNGLSVTSDGILTIDTTAEGAWSDSVTPTTDGLIVLELSDGFNLQEIEIKVTALDSDNDGIADHTDPDRDGDDVANELDAFPDDSMETADSDGDGVGDNTDAFPNDAGETVDSDGDGVGDNSDIYPNNAAESADSDGDGVGDNADAFPKDASETIDSDGDGVGDNSDVYPNNAAESADSDGDGVGDNSDAFPNDASETADSDGDGVGDNSDAFPNDASETTDSDGDGIGDNSDAYPDDATRSEASSAKNGSGGGGSFGFFGLLLLLVTRLVRRR